MNELVKVDFDSQRVSARELHKSLQIATRFNDWFTRMCEYGFTEGEDFYSKMSKSSGGRPSTDYDLSMDMAKHICMIQRSPAGKKVRQYLIDLEDAWNKPELVMARALNLADKQIQDLTEKNKVLTDKIEADKPKTIFADAVTASTTSILVRDLAKMIRQNGVEIGEKRLYKWMRDNGYICKGDTSPTQRAMEMGLFEIEAITIKRADQLPIERRTTKVTGKGQVYFCNKFLNQNEVSA